MLHFTQTAEPKLETHYHPMLDRLASPFREPNFGLEFAPTPDEQDELLQAIQDEIDARQMTLEELAERPDFEAINQFLDGALNDFRKDGIDYAEE